jgi:hypothetical protein
VNDIVVGNVSFAPTGAWNTWQTVTVTLTLANGSHSIRLTANTNSGGPNIDRLELR